MTNAITILGHTPFWVFAVFLLLAQLGARQWVGGSSTLKRAVLVPAAMALWSLYSTVSHPGQTPAALEVWGATALCCAALVLSRALPVGTVYDVAEKRFHQPGSPVPLMLMMGIFFLRYAVTVMLLMHPALTHDIAFTLTTSALYGALAGTFAARAIRLGLLAARTIRSATSNPLAGSNAAVGRQIL